MATTTHILGYPRIGEKRELKFAQEKYCAVTSFKQSLKKLVQICALKTGKHKQRLV